MLWNTQVDAYIHTSLCAPCIRTMNTLIGWLHTMNTTTATAFIFGIEIHMFKPITLAPHSLSPPSTTALYKDVGVWQQPYLSCETLFVG